MKYYENETIDTKIIIYPKDKESSNGDLYWQLKHFDIIQYNTLNSLG